ncbi:MAG: hypothetical protein IJ455_09060 [Agathobacter sp.]|nr:hypothetical protein [Agathobacter sp.]
MIIQTSSVGTSASRRYQHNQISYAEHSEWDNATGAFSQAICSSTIQANEESFSRNGAACLPEKDYLDATEYVSAPEEGTEEVSDDTNKDKTTLDSEMDALLKRFGPLQMKGIPTIQDRLEMVRDIKQKSLDYLLRILFGDDEKYVKDVNSMDRSQANAPDLSNQIDLTSLPTLQGESNLGTGWSHYSFYYCAESETTCFDTTGTAITTDGRKLSFNISLEMSRSFVEMAEEQIDFGQPRLCDPLVINLNTNVASVSDQKFFFDIDADGEEDEISMLDKDSGYLALDTNADGIINDGSELFGTQSGNGFKDLLAHDEDANGWIDEDDSIFQKLKIWTMDENGISTLIDLKEAGVGAIYLGYENTEFSLKNANHETNAVIQKTGLFLYENGNSGTVQQMDLAV